MSRGPTVHLIDASPYIFRAWFGLTNEILDPDGRPVTAVKGFLDFLIRYVREQEPTHLGVAFDRSLTTSFRNEIYPPYKAQRDLPPPELEAQLDDCETLAGALGAATFSSERYEADDLIATLSRQLAPQQCRVIVVTSDKDLAQLVTDDLTLFDFARGKRYGPAEVEEKFGVRPDQIVDFLGLAGDSVDNIPGVKGVGKKSAAALLQGLGDLDAVYADLDKVEELPVRGAKGLRKKLARDKEQALLSRQLARVAYDAPVAASLEELLYRGADTREVDPLFDRLGFGAVYDRIPYWR